MRTLRAMGSIRTAALRAPLAALFAALFVLAAAAAPAAEPRVVIALDSSRSLSAEQSRAAAALARDLLVRLAATSEPSVLTFDDSVHWLTPTGTEPTAGRSTAADADRALAALRPGGRYTVLHDGLVEGIRRLADGGVLVLISDGQDENSATTLEDVARLASERGVRVVTLGAGRVDERTMKRLALLTGGLYVGVATDADVDALTAEVEALRRQVAAEKIPPPAAAVAPAAIAAPAPPAAAAAPPEGGVGSRALLLALALVAAMGLALGFLLARRRTQRAPAKAYDPDIGTQPGVLAPAAQLPGLAEPESSPLDEIELARLRARPPVAPAALFEISLDDAAALQRLPFSEAIERTLVLVEEVVLTVREPGQAARTFRIPPDRAIDIGREAARNTLAFHDPTLSVQHLRLALADGEILLLDLGSTNGVLFEGRRVSSARLQPGDRFRAGMIEFELDLHRASTN